MGKMAQWIKVFATKAGNLSSVPRIHVVGENQLHELSSDLHMCIVGCAAHAHTRTHAHDLKIYPKNVNIFSMSLKHNFIKSFDCMCFLINIKDIAQAGRMT